MVMMMRTFAVLFLFLFAIPQNAISKDYLIELFEEHYREKMIVGGGEMQIYHTWQAKPGMVTNFLYLWVMIMATGHG